MSLARAVDVVTPARVLALSVLGRMERSTVPLDDVFDAEAASLGPSRTDRALAQQIAYGVIRYRRRLDAIGSQYANKGLPADPRVRIVLRAGIFQLVFLDRVPVSAVVNTSVEAVKALGRGPQSGFVNAVLRRIAGDAQTHRSAEPPAGMEWAVYESFPDWMVERFATELDANVPAMLSAMNGPAPLTLRARDGDGAALAAALEHAEPCDYSRAAVRITTPVGPVTELPGWSEAAFVVQDEAAQLVTAILDPRDEERILDIGAAPGGKSFHIADLIGAQHVTAVDASQPRLDKMKQEAERLGHAAVELVHADLIKDPEAVEAAAFDRVLVDAPCSSLGVIRRKPDIKWSRGPEDIARFAGKQAALLEAAARALKPGGTLVYSVCTFTTEETTEVADQVDLGRVGALAHLPTLVATFGFRETDFRAIPHIHGTDGFYVASWQKNR